MGSVPLVSCWFSSFFGVQEDSGLKNHTTVQVPDTVDITYCMFLLSSRFLLVAFTLITGHDIDHDQSPSSSSNQSGWWIDCVYTYTTFAPDSIHPISISIMNSYRSILFFAAETEDSFRCHYHLFEQGRVTGLQSTPVRVGWLVPGWNIIY